MSNSGGFKFIDQNDIVRFYLKMKDEFIADDEQSHQICFHCSIIKNVQFVIIC